MRPARPRLATLGLILASAMALASVAVAAPSSAVSGIYLAGGKPAVITDVSAHKDEPFDGHPVTDLVFTATSQGGDANAEVEAHNGKYGDAIVVRVETDGTIIGADMLHHGLTKSNGYVTAVGVLSLKDFHAEGGELSGVLTSGGKTDVFGQQINVSLTFHTKTPAASD